MLPVPVTDVGLATMFHEAATRQSLAAFAIGLNSTTAFAGARVPVQVLAYGSVQGAVWQLFASATANGPHYRGSGGRPPKVLLSRRQGPMV